MWLSSIFKYSNGFLDKAKEVFVVCLGFLVVFRILVFTLRYFSCSSCVFMNCDVF